MQPSRSAAPTRLTFSAGTLLLKGMSHERVARVFESLPWKWDRRVAAWRCDALWYAEVRECLSRDVCEFRDDVANWSSVRWRSVKIHPLRAEQQTAVEAWQNTRRACIVMPTGTGKTEVALSIMAETAVSTLVVAPVRDLMYQWHRRIADGLEYDAEIIGFWTPEYLEAKVQTLRMFQDHRILLAVSESVRNPPPDVMREAVTYKSALLINDVLNRLTAPPSGRKSGSSGNNRTG
jgi:hypothetical protein